MLHPGQKPTRCYVQQCFEGEKGIFVAATDYVKALPCSIAKWLPGRLTALGTDGYGRSDSRSALRNYFEVDARHITLAALHALAAEGRLDVEVAKKAAVDLDIDPDKVDPVTI